jgi:hypothetical protein
MRNISLSVGNGTQVTLFASIGTGWNYFSQEDATRLTTDKWKPHQWDLLAHMMVQGVWTYEDLLDKYNAEGAYTMMSLIDEPLKFDFDHGKQKMTMEGGELFFPNIQGVDG